MKDNEKEQIEEMYRDYGYKCFVCGKPVKQRAHIISNSKMSRKKYGDIAVDSVYNWLPACSLECNALIDSGHASLLSGNIYSLIHSGSKKEIDRLIRENIKRKLDKI